MGNWGFKLYDNDIALDVKDQFIESYYAGKDVQEITNDLIEYYKCVRGDSNEESLFWLALADTQWDLGVLLLPVKKRALYWIERSYCELKKQTVSVATQACKKRALDDLYIKLLSAQPSVYKPTRKKLYHCSWKIGDVFAYRMESSLSLERGFGGRFLLIQKIDEGRWYPGHTIPIVYVKITKDANLPTSTEEYNQLEYVQTWFVRYSERFWPIDMHRPAEDIVEKSKLSYEVDDYGFLPMFRLELLNTSPKVIPKKLIYVGNFSDALRPQKEFIPFSKENIPDASWDSFEEKMVTRYCGHNLRELSIYADSIE